MKDNRYFLCMQDFWMVDRSRVVFQAGVIYESSNSHRSLVFTDEEGDPHHMDFETLIKSRFVEVKLQKYKMYC